MEKAGEKMGKSKGYIANIEAGVSGLSLTRLADIAEVYGVDPAWLAGFRELDSDPYVSGTSDFITDDIVLKSAYLEKKGLDCNHLFCFQVEGDSMQPELYDGNLAIADMSTRGILDRDLYILKIDNKYAVRWVGQTIDGNYKIESETNNPFFLPNCTITPEELTQIEVVGRVELVIG